MSNEKKTDEISDELRKKYLEDFVFNSKSAVSKEMQMEIHISISDRIANIDWAARAKKSRKMIEGFRRGMIMTKKALDHSYDGNLYDKFRR